MVLTFYDLHLLLFYTPDGTTTLTGHTSLTESAPAEGHTHLPRAGRGIIRKTESGRMPQRGKCGAAPC